MQSPAVATCAVIRWKCEGPRFEVCWPKLSLGLRNEHLEGDGPTVFAHVCKLGLEGIVSKRKDSPYRLGRSPHWLKMKSPAAPTVKREADWGR
jgi:hypothetical protein